MINKQRMTWFIDKLAQFFVTFRYPLLFLGILVYFLSLEHGMLPFTYKIGSIVFGAFSGLFLLTCRHYLVNLQEKNPIPLMFPIPVYLLYFYYLLSASTVAAGISFALFITGIAMFNVIDIFWRDLKESGI